MDLGRAFSFSFEDKDWLKKIGIAALVMLIPVVGSWTVAGWGVEIARRVIHRETDLLPDWSNFGDHFIRGLKAFVIGLVYSLPAILLSFCANSPTMFMTDADETTMTALSILSICFGCLAAIVGLLVAFVALAAMGNFAATGDLGSAFRFGEVIAQVRRNPSAYLLALLGTVIAGILASLGVILCIIGVLFTSAIAYAIQGHLIGQAYLASNGRGSSSLVGGAQTF